MTPPGPDPALFFDPDGYVEQLGPPKGAPPGAGGPVGLMGRQVAGKEFLDAYLSHGRWDALTAVVRAKERAGPLAELVKAHPAARGRGLPLRVVEEAAFARVFGGPTSPARALYFPQPPDARYAWLRHASAPGCVALSGVTHTLSSAGAVAGLCELVLAPFEHYDALICTSRAVANMVRAVTGSYAAYLKDRFGGSPSLRVRLELIPLGVNTDKFRPPTPEGRAAARRQFSLADDEVMLLCVGRLSHHAKAHPYPVFYAAGEAAKRTGRKVHLVMAGWASNAPTAEAFRAGAAAFAPPAKVSFVDGQDPAVRAGVWPAADVVISLPDNIQETFGLVVVEGMATGVPVVGSDWDGYKDLVVDGETGYLVPTRMVRGAASGTTGRLLAGQVNYDYFLAECCQTVAVDPEGAAAAVARLVADDALRARLGAAGRARAEARFAWRHVVRAYEELWADQARELAAAATPAPAGPVRYPPPDVSFDGYPTGWLDDASPVVATAGAAGRLAVRLGQPLTNLVAYRRCADPAVLADLLGSVATPRPVGELAAALEAKGFDAEMSRATVAWLLKYGLLAAPL